MTRRSWPLIGLAFASLLTLICASALDVTRQIRVAHDNILRLDEPAKIRARALTEVREKTSTLVLGVRDCLLASHRADPHVINGLRAIQDSIHLSVDELEAAQDESQRDLVTQLRAQLDRYWLLAGDAVAWPAARQRINGPAFLQNTLTPLRESGLESMRGIESIEQVLRDSRRDRIEKAFDELNNALGQILLGALLIGTLIALFTVWRFALLERRTTQLRAQTEIDRQQMRVLSQKLVHSHEEERRVLSRELHDQIGQMLTAIQMAFNNIGLRQGDAQRHIDDGKSLTERTVAAVRNISMGLRPSILDDLGLGPAIEWQAREFSKRSGVPVELQMDGKAEHLSESQKTCLYRVIQEALTNCARHASARSVRITFHAGRESISLTVSDDGRGFDPRQPCTFGLGVFGMKERVREIGGTLSILSQPGRGTLLKVEAPANEEVSA